MDIEMKLQELIEVAEEWNWQQSGILKTEIIQHVRALEAQLTPAQLHLADHGELIEATFYFMAEPPQLNDRYLIEPCSHCKEWSYKDGLVKGLCKACREQLGTQPDES